MHSVTLAVKATNLMFYVISQVGVNRTKWFPSRKFTPLHGMDCRIARMDSVVNLRHASRALAGLVLYEILQEAMLQGKPSMVKRCFHTLAIIRASKKISVLHTGW